MGYGDSGITDRPQITWPSHTKAEGVEDSRKPPCWIGQVEEEEQGDRKKVKGREERAKAHQGPPEVPLGA